MFLCIATVYDNNTDLSVNIVCYGVQFKQNFIILISKARSAMFKLISNNSTCKEWHKK